MRERECLNFNNNEMNEREREREREAYNDLSNDFGLAKGFEKEGEGTAENKN